MKYHLFHGFKNGDDGDIAYVWFPPRCADDLERLLTAVNDHSSTYGSSAYFFHIIEGKKVDLEMASVTYKVKKKE